MGRDAKVQGDLYGVPSHRMDTNNFHVARGYVAGSMNRVGGRGDGGEMRNF